MNYNSIHAGEDEPVGSYLACTLDNIVYMWTYFQSFGLAPIKNISGEYYGSNVRASTAIVNIVIGTGMPVLGEFDGLSLATDELFLGEGALSAESQLVGNATSSLSLETVGGETNPALFSKLTATAPAPGEYLAPIFQSEHAEDFLDLVNEINKTPGWQAGQVDLQFFQELTGQAKGGALFLPAQGTFVFTEDISVLSAIEEDAHWNLQMVTGRWQGMSEAEMELEAKMDVWSAHSQFMSDEARAIYSTEIQDAAANIR